jgi:hypothetical protein
MKSSRNPHSPSWCGSLGLHRLSVDSPGRARSSTVCCVVKDGAMICTLGLTVDPLLHAHRLAT